MQRLIEQPGETGVTDDGGSTPVEVNAAAWYALRTASNRQFRVREALRERGIEEFLPAYFEEVRWTDRTKRSERAFFPGYVFARFSLSSRRELEAIPGVVGIVSCGSDPAAIDATELESLRRVVETIKTVLPCAYVAGETVEISRGPLAGARGIVTRTKGAVRLVVAIEILRRAVSVEIDAADVTSD